MNKQKMWVRVGVLLLCCASAQAEQWYVGVGAGVAQVDALCDGAARNLCDDNGGAGRLTVGWKFNPYLALEGAIDFGSDFTAPGARAFGLDGETDVSFLALNLIGFAPLGQRVSLYGGVGGAFSSVRTAVYDYRYRDSQDCEWQYDYYDDDWDYYCRNRNEEDDYETESSVAASALLGAEIHLGRHVLVRVQGQRYFNVDGGIAFGERRAVDVVTANILVAFGKRATR